MGQDVLAICNLPGQIGSIQFPSDVEDLDNVQREVHGVCIGFSDSRKECKEWASPHLFPFQVVKADFIECE